MNNANYYANMLPKLLRVLLGKYTYSSGMQMPTGQTKSRSCNWDATFNNNTTVTGLRPVSIKWSKLTLLPKRTITSPTPTKPKLYQSHLSSPSPIKITYSLLLSKYTTATTSMAKTVTHISINT